MVSNNGRMGASSYERKFGDLIHLLAETKEDVVLIHHPQVLGDTYEEIVESLDRLADAKRSSWWCPGTKGAESQSPRRFRYTKSARRCSS